MKASIQTKLLLMCILLVLITTSVLSFSYYTLSKREAQRESQARIQIAFDIIFDDFAQQEQFYRRQFQEFVIQTSSLEWALFSYKNNPAELGSSLFIVSYLAPFANKLRDFSDVVGASQLALYAWDARLLAIYQHDESGASIGEADIIGTYATSGQGIPSFLAVTQELSLLGTTSIPEYPLPASVAPAYIGDIPPDVVIEPFQHAHKPGVRVHVPVYRKEEIIGVLVGDILYTQEMIQRYASLSKTDVNMFVQDQFSLGTLPTQSPDSFLERDERIACEELRQQSALLPISLMSINDVNYYQGFCELLTVQGEPIGAISVNLSQALEHEQVRAMLWAVLRVSGIVLVAAFMLSFLVSRKAVHTIENLVRVIGAAAQGDLRPAAIATSNDEFGTLARSLNQMITQLRTISLQVQDSSSGVNNAAETVFREMDALMGHMEEQTTSVDHTTMSIEMINRFIDTVAQNTLELLSTTAEILSSIQETRSSVQEVSASTGALTINLEMISAAIDQVNQSAKRISEDSGTLEDIARQTESEIRHIEASFTGVSQHAEQNQQSAQKTMHAVTLGQQSVEASVQGMLELKDVATNTAQIIKEVNSWGAQVSSILGIVDEITGQTALLSLNASIISAQAGAHGRGFAVVADEIKQLADRTKNSTKEIATLVHALQKKTAEGVKNTEEGIAKAEEGVQRANAAKAALATILEQASQSSQRAEDTAAMIQQTAGSSQIIGASMNQVTEMVSHIRHSLQEERTDITQVVSAVENISGMAQQVNRASLEQQQSAEQIARSMEDATERFSDISDQTATLRQEANQILAAMRTIEAISETIRQNAAGISGDTVENLVKHSDALQNVVKVFKLS